LKSSWWADNPCTMEALLERLELMESGDYAKPTRSAVNVEGLLFMPTKSGSGKKPWGTRAGMEDKTGYTVWHSGPDGGPHLVGTVSLHHADGHVVRVNENPLGNPKFGPAKNFRDRGGAAKFLVTEFGKNSKRAK